MRVASILLRSWIYRFGVPKKIVSDNDPSFCAEVVQRVSARLGITRLRSTPYHPEGNGPIESFHRVLSGGLRNVKQHVVPFKEALQLVLFGYRATIHTTTGHSPSFLTFGIDPRLATDQDWRMEPSLLNQERLKFLSTLRLDVQLQAQLVLIRSNMQKNENRIEEEFEENQLILCRALPLDRLRYRSAFHKAVPRWTLPHRIKRVLGGGKSAIVQCLITGKSRQIHIQDARFINPPQGEVQTGEWKEIIEAESATMYNKETCQEIIEQFFDQLQQPQALGNQNTTDGCSEPPPNTEELQGKPGRKRRRFSEV